MKDNMTPLQQRKLEFYEQQFGRMTSEEALACAISDEQIGKDCGPFDPVAGRFYQSRENLLNYAELLEKKEQQS